MISSQIGQSAMESQILNQSILSPKAVGKHRSYTEELLLTALVDAFSILVIFLLLSFTNSGELIMIGKDTELPKAAQNKELQINPVLKMEQGQIFLDNKVVNVEGLVAALVELRVVLAEKFKVQGLLPENETYAVTIQADRRVRYTELNQLIVACANAGFSDLHFAVLAK